MIKIEHYFDRNFIITGIPRSGTSLFCSIVNGIDDTICFNEIQHVPTELDFYNIAMLPAMFSKTREMISKGIQIPIRVNELGKETTNTMKDGQEITTCSVKQKDGYWIGSKINAPYLFAIEMLIKNHFPVFAIIRDPVYVLGSYQMPWTRTLNIVNCETDQRYNWFDFKGKTRIEHQAELWEYFARKILNIKNELKIYRYEDIFTNGEEIIKDFCKIMNIPFKLNYEFDKLKSKNDPKNYKKISQIKKAVEEYCPSIKDFDYVL